MKKERQYSLVGMVSLGYEIKLGLKFYAYTPNALPSHS